ncbi:MAG: hypothetical protein HFACDABA_03229 [Anaerolineales bacterium]|nr:hypothetical protein [Anaerolineales bacterium]
MKEFRQYLIALLVMTLALSLYLPARYDSPYPRPITPQFDTHIRKVYLEEISAKRSEMVLLGDSMLAPAVDPAALGARLGMNPYMISLPGSASTLWYLIAKNNIVDAQPRPKYLVIFFRDSMMTVPGYRVTGRYFEQIDEFARPQDGELIQRAYLDQMNPLEKVAEAYLPIYGLRWRIREGLDTRMRYALPKAIGCDQPCMDNAMEVVFGSLNIDLVFLSEAQAAADDYLYSRNVLDFESQVGDSFLPDLINLCQYNGIQLVLVRMRILRFVTPGSEPPALHTYGEQLRAYLEASGVIYLDYSDYAALTEDDFSDPVHLNKQGQALFTETFGNDLAPWLK